MKTIEERAKEWAYKYPMTPDGYLTESDMRAIATNSYIQGATEQKAIDEAIRLKKCDDMTEAEYNREVAFIDWFYENSGGTIAHSDAIEWARKDLLDKACEWLKERVQCGVHSQRAYGFVEEFRKAMEK